MILRMLPSLPSTLSRRTYSFFSSKPGGGRYFTPSKAAKVAVAKPTATTANAPPATKPGSPDVGTQALPAVTEASSPGSVSRTLVEPESAVTPAPAMASPTFSSRPQVHPQTNLPTLHLHNFFALDRPLLLLSQPTNSLFEPMPQPQSQATPPNNLFGEDIFGLGHQDPEADVNAARLLARSLVMQRVGSTMEWSEIMVKLGAQDEMVIEMDSVKRKRRKKMNKHRYKKRRKLQRAERRRLKK